MSRYIFLRTAWMEHYKGVKKNDIPIGAGSYVTENADGGEVYNFQPLRGKYYGYARIQKGRGLRLTRLGASTGDELIEDITVVLFGRNPETGGQRIIGWYEHATLYRDTQRLQNNKRNNHPWYVATAEVDNAYLVPEDNRLFPVPDNGPGQSNAWYVEEYDDRNYLREVQKYISNPEGYIFRKRKKGGGWQKDAALRQKIEWAAMETVADYFESRNYRVEYRHKENLGWDLEASLGRQTLLLEVKGLSGDLMFVDFTPNEYENCYRNSHYRICIVSNALNKNLKLDIFFREKQIWTNKKGDLLLPKTRQSARFFYKQASTLFKHKSKTISHLN